MKILTIKIREIGLSKLFFYILVFLIPLQTRKIFFTDQSFYFGYHAFYNTFYLYLTDIVILGLIVIWLWEKWNDTRETKLLHRIFTKIAQDKVYRYLLLFFFISLASLIIPQNAAISLSLYGVVKLVEFIALFAYIKEEVNLSRERFTIFWLILATSSIQAVIATWQYVIQSSLGLKIFGEEFLKPGIRGIAEFISRETLNPVFYDFFPYLRPVTDDLVVNIRAYGTFPHPNVLAGFLIVGLLANLYLLHRRITFHRKIFHRNVENGKKRGISGERSLNWLKIGILSISLIMISTGLVVTFSRFAWFVAGVSILTWLVIFVFRQRRSLIYIVGLLGLALAINWFLFGAAIRDRVVGLEPVGLEVQDYQQSESISQRKLFNEVAFEVIKAKPLLGVGVKQFVLEMDNYYSGDPGMNPGQGRLLPFQHQPAHNIYLLIASEIGVIGGAVFLIFLYSIARLALPKAQAESGPGATKQKKDSVFRYTLLVMVIGLFVIGLLDHYPWTIQQGSLLFWTMLGLAAASE